MIYKFNPHVKNTIGLFDLNLLCLTCKFNQLFAKCKCEFILFKKIMKSV